jgi:hypothetical protein
MNHKDFSKLLRERQSKERDVMVTKAGEYANDDERFSNFHNGAPFMASGNTPEACLWNYLSKHLVAVRDAINQIELGVVKPMEFWDEKLGDMRNYSVLLEGLITDRLRAVNKN